MTSTVSLRACAPTGPSSLAKCDTRTRTSSPTSAGLRASLSPLPSSSAKACLARLVTDKNGKRLGIYRKTHIPAILPSDLPGGTGSYEKFYFSPGIEFPVFDLCGTKIGIQICYDRKYPEGSRLLALKGAEILFMPICAATYGETKLR